MNSSGTSTIADETLNCFEQFKAIREVVSDENHTQGSVTLPSSLSRDAIIDSFGRFNIWVGNIGALSRGRSSLDHRLAHTDVRLEVSRLLHQLRLAALELWRIISGSRQELTWFAGDPIESFESFSEGSDTEESEHSWTPPEIEDDPTEELSIDGPGELQTESKQLHLLVTETITSLFKLSIFIRKSTKVNKFAKSSAEKKYDTQPDISHARSRFPYAAGNLALIDRLGKANAQRRQWISYKKRHREKLGTQSGSHGSNFLHPTSHSAMQAREQNLEARMAVSTTSGGLRSAVTELSSTEASTFYDQSRNDLEDQSEAGFSETTYNESKISDSEGEALYVPQPPHDSENENPFECPYCFTILTIKNRNEWIRHVHSDLASYVCTEPNCSHPLFESRHQWFNHELEVHRLEWKCTICSMTLLSQFALEQHLLQEHSDVVGSSQLPAAIAHSSRPLQRIPASACPLCDYDEILRRRLESGVTASVTTHPMTVKPRAFSAHLGRHLEQLALFVLPKSELMELEPPGLSQAAQNDHLVPSDKADSTGGSDFDVEEHLESAFYKMEMGGETDPFKAGQTTIASDDILEELDSAPELAMGWLPPMNFTPPKSDFDVDDSDWAPRREDSMFGGDLFTPGWVRGFGKDKEGFCGRCEPGVWHKMDDLSYENDLTYRHGIDSSGIPLSRPSSIRRNEDGGSGWEGYCEDCGGWKTIRATKLGWNWFRHCVREHKWGGVLKPVDVAVGNSQAEAMKTLTKHVLAKEFPQAESIIDQQPWTLEFRDYRGRSILHLAAEVGHLQTVEVILAACSRVSGLKSMADLIDASSVEGETSLMIAATQGNHDVLNMLISRGASLDSTSNDGKTALDFAAEAGYQRIVVDLVRGHANTGISHVYNQLRLQALRAAKRKSVSGAENIQEVPKEAKDAESYNTPLMMASAAGDVGKVELLLEGGVDIEECTSEGENALMVAAAHRHMEVMGMLLKHGANIDATNTKGWTTLMLSVRSNDEKTVRLLLSLGADVNHLSPDRWTALAEATFQGQTAIIALLLENGADTESKSSHDWTPLMHAAYKGDEEAVMLLLDAGAAMNTSSLHDETAILLAAAGSHTRIASILLKAGCAPEPAWALSSFPSENKGPLNEGEGKAHDRATVGWTPLMLACQNGLEDVVEMLLAKNVNLEPQSPYRKTALVIAKENGRATIARMLEEYTMGSRS